RGRTILRHLGVEVVISEVGRAEERRLLCAKLRDLADGCARIVGVSVLGAIEACFEQLLPRRVTGQRFKRGLLRRVLERKDVARKLAALRSLVRRRDLLRRETGERRGIVDVKRASFGGCE